MRIALMTVLIGLLLACPARAGYQTERDAYLAEQARAFLSLSLPDGSFSEPHGPDRAEGYGTAMLADVLVGQGYRDENPEMIAAAARAINLTLDRSPLVDPFAAYALADIVAETRTVRLRGEIKTAVQRAEDALAGFESGQQKVSDGHGSCYMDPGCYNNWKLVEAAALARALRAEVPFTPGGAVDGDEGARVRVRSIIDRATGAAGPSFTGPLGRTSVLSDPSHHPPAYHVFSLALMLSVYRDRPDLVSPAAQAQMARSLRWMLTFADPDGVVAYSGRSQQQSWVLAAEIYVCAHAKELMDPEETARCGWLTERAWRRLLDVHRTAGPTVSIAPSVTERHDFQGLDGYAGARVYGGLTLQMLHRAATGAELSNSSELPLAASDWKGTGLLTAVRHGAWMAVQARQTHPDARYALGLLDVKVADFEGRWTALLYGREYATNSLDGPAFIAGFQRPLKPSGPPKVQGASVTLSGTWARSRRPGQITYTLSRTGVTVTVAAPRNASLSWTQAIKNPVVRGRGADGPTSELRFDRPVKLTSRRMAVTAPVGTVQILVWKVKTGPDGKFTVRISRR